MIVYNYNILYLYHNPFIMNKFLWILATWFMFVLNFLASTYTLGGSTTAELSAKFTTLITPAGFTFAIRSLIYLGILVVSFLYLFKKRVILKTTHKRYLLSCLVNGLWIVAWHYQNLHAAMALMLILLVSLIMIDLSLKEHKKLAHYHIIRNAFLLYFGWILIATLLMTTIYLTYGVWLLSADNSTRALSCLVVWWLLWLLIAWKERNIIPLLVFCRALFGIYSANGSVFRAFGR